MIERTQCQDTSFSTFCINSKLSVYWWMALDRMKIVEKREIEFFALRQFLYDGGGIQFNLIYVRIAPATITLMAEMAKRVT